MRSTHKSLLLLASATVLVFGYQNCGKGFGTSVDSSATNSQTGSGSPQAGSSNPPAPADPTDQGRRILKVCPSGCPYSLPSQANADAQDTDIVEVEAGLYQDCFTISKNGLKYRGVNGRAHLSTAMCGGKGSIVIYGSDTVIENFEFSEMAVPDRNGAGIRHQGLGLIVRNSYFHDGENGILSGSGTADSVNPKDTVLVENSKFEHLGGDTGHSHAVYFGYHQQVTVKNSVFSASRDQGHEFKSRAKNTLIDCSYLASFDGLDSYTLNFPDAGAVQVQNSVVEQGANTSNSGIVDYGSEMLGHHAVNTLSFSKVVFLNDLDRGTFFNVRNSSQFQLSESKIIGPGSLYSQQTALEQSVDQISNRSVAGYPPYPTLPKPAACAGSIGLLN